MADRPTIKKGVMGQRLALALVIALTARGAYADPAAAAAGMNGVNSAPGLTLGDLATFHLGGKSITLGLAYAQGTYKTGHAGAVGGAMMTDNGAPSPIIEFNGGEHLLSTWPMRDGNLLVGWNITATASYFKTSDQLVNSAFHGSNIGTSVSGGYLGVAPMVFIKMGPLGGRNNVYWKAAYGLGPGLLKSAGDARFETTGGPVIYSVGSSTPQLALYNTASWQLQVNRWYFKIFGQWLDYDRAHNSFESYGFGVAYRVDLK